MSEPLEHPDAAAEVATGTSVDAFLAAVKHNRPATVSVRKFLGLWGYKRRGAFILRVIERELSVRGLTSFPDVAHADYYGDIQILDQRDLAGVTDREVGWPISSVLDVERDLVAVGPDEPLPAVETLMIMHDFSQIPVLNKTRRDLHGSVTWQSIARWEGDRSTATARHVMDADVQTARSSDNLLDHIKRIIENEFLYIQDPTGVYVGILTATDLAEGFLATSGPFIMIGEIEHRLRAIVNQLPLPLLQETDSPSERNKEIGSAADLSFGSYVRILEKDANWNQLGLPFDRTTVVKNLREVNAARNDIMHFRPNELDPQALEAIDRCLNWLRAVRGR